MHQASLDAGPVHAQVIPARVALARATTYEPAPLRAAVEAALAPLGGLAAFVHPGDRVLLKPNLLAAHPPERAVTTHPALVRTVAELVRDCGGRVLLGDSPGFGSLERVARVTGAARAVEAVGGRLVTFTAPASARSEPSGLARGELARELADIDVLVNLPKCKTHALAGLTLAVKNCFGLVVGARKLQWHYRAGHDRALFARMLLDVYRAGAPQLSLLDGVWGMDGQGPSSGRARPVGFLAASADGLALDAAVARLLGCEPLDLPVPAAATEDRARWLEPELVGARADDLAVGDFALPTTRSFRVMGPRVFVPFLRRWLTDRPEVLDDRCTGCGRCAQVCPAGAIAMHAGRPRIDHAACIRCYCCHELCPEQAIRRASPLPARLLVRWAGA